MQGNPNTILNDSIHSELDISYPIYQRHTLLYTFQYKSSWVFLQFISNKQKNNNNTQFLE